MTMRRAILTLCVLAGVVLTGCHDRGDNASTDQPLSESPTERAELTEADAFDAVWALPGLAEASQRITEASGGINSMHLRNEGESEDFFYVWVYEDTPDFAHTINRYWVDRETGEALVVDPLTGKPFALARIGSDR
jgi:hypothetical protein